MKVNSRFAGLIVATGDITNHMRIDPLEKTGTIPVLSRMVDTLYSAGAYPIVMITGQKAWEVERYCANRGIIFIRADDYEKLTMIQMLQGGCAYLEGKHKTIVVTSVEFPFFQAETIKEATKKKCTAGVSVFQNMMGFPVVLGGEFISSIQEAGPVEDIIEYLDKQAGAVMLETEDEGIIRRTEGSGGQPDKAIEQNDSRLCPHIRIEIGSKKLVFDPRLKTLLFLLDENGSIKISGLHASLSLALAWEMIEELEVVLGCQVVTRFTDPLHGGRDEERGKLTEAGLDFLTKYIKYERQLIRYANRTFEDLFYEKDV